MLAIARGLIPRPTILLLDEPTLGLAPKIAKEVFERLVEINKRHKTGMMIVEHNVKSLLPRVERAYILDKGKIAMEGTPEEIETSGVFEKVFLSREAESQYA